ncbi:hypothetical protein QTP70_020836 [Hemibagrus guttatus]|uniref:Glycoprotein endo-alpha-1,2-mannosidase-like protein n=1 Tax=Hemibagrus guttatus TaxID=175788 RepID=A0AAE0RES2_9TELE|nr:hypothetical protein QTP70_020836 [Hemibagrus guttatus]
MMGPRLHSFIHCLPLIRTILGSWGACAYLRRHWALSQDTPWTECQPIAGYTHTLIHSHTTDNLEMPINLPRMFLDWGRKPERTPEARGEHASSTHMAEAGIESPILEPARFLIFFSRAFSENMARLRRRSCVLLILFGLFVLGTLMGLRTLKPSDGFSDLDVLPIKEAKVHRHVVVSDVLSSAGQERFVASNAKPAASNPSTDRGASYDVHIFYYTWYGNPQTDERYLHWDHVLVPHWDPKIAASYPKGRHVPPEDIGSSFYPELGPYSSRDPEVLESHMEQISTAGAGVVVLSWYPLGLADDHGEPSEDLVPWILDAALRHNLKNSRHLCPPIPTCLHSLLYLFPTLSITLNC